MPFYDRKCTDCELIRLDCHEPISAEDYPCGGGCQGTMKRAWIGGKGPKAHGDEIDIRVSNALCHADGSPRRFRSKTELRKAEQKAGVSLRVQHVGEKGSDKSKHTQRWF